jgi:hypothetical protein
MDARVGVQEARLLAVVVLVEGLLGDLGAFDDVGDGDPAITLDPQGLAQRGDHPVPLVGGDLLPGQVVTPGRQLRRHCANPRNLRFSVHVRNSL